MNIRIDLNRLSSNRTPSKLLGLIGTINDILDVIIYKKGTCISFEESYRSIYSLILYYKGYVTLYKLLQNHENVICNSDYIIMKERMDLITDICLYPLKSIERGNELDNDFVKDGKTQLKMWFDKMKDIELLKHKSHISLIESNINFPVEIKSKIEMHVI